MAELSTGATSGPLSNRAWLARRIESEPEKYSLTPNSLYPMFGATTLRAAPARSAQGLEYLVYGS